MTKKKICLIGGFAVGKTSIVRRYVSGIFSDDYLTTVGVKIDKRVVRVDGESVTLVIWDLAGEDDLITVRMSYLRGANGCLLVADGTRPETLDVALKLHERIGREVGSIPSVFALNKCDLTAEWDLDEDEVRARAGSDTAIITTSAKDGRGVEEAFARLARQSLTS